MKKTVAVGLSGGVDSAVSALLLKQQGFEVTGVFLYCFDQKGIPCTADEDRKMAVKVADSLHIPIKIIDLRTQYTKSVIDYFFSEYRAGRTPNPDVMCNKEIKFGLFYKKAIEDWGMDYVATGHYARIMYNVKCKMYNLAKGIDETKDQSYFLYPLKGNQLEHILFPIGEYKKEQVRKIAKQNKLPNWDRPDSQGICFVGEINIRKFLSTKFQIQKGAVLDRKGDVIGEHEGVWFYTIGQRHGFKIMNNLKCIPQSGISFHSTMNNEEKKPLYILSKNRVRNKLIVGEKEECFSRVITVNNWHWINSPVIASTFASLSVNSAKQSGNFKRLLRHFVPRNDKLTVRIRHLGELYICQLHPYKSYKKYNSYKLLLDKPAFAVAPGQSAVVYLDNIVLGGGIIV